MPRAGRNYFAGPYLRDELLGMGVLVETLETATTWSRLQELYTAVGDALRGALAARGTDALVMCHVSHLYRSGASLYFSFFARQEQGAELEQWRAAKTAACDAIVAHGGHHHSPPRDRARPRGLDGSGGGGGRRRGTAWGQGQARPRGDHESREAASLARGCSAPTSAIRCSGSFLGE